MIVPDRMFFVMPSRAWHVCEIKIGWFASGISCDWTLPGNIRREPSSLMAIGIFSFPVVVSFPTPVEEVALWCIHSGLNPSLGPLELCVISPKFSMATRVASFVDNGIAAVVGEGIDNS